MLVRIMSWYRGMKTKKDRAVSTVLCLDFVEVEEELVEEEGEAMEEASE